jgi:hypothetical protein
MAGPSLVVCEDVEVLRRGLKSLGFGTIQVEEDLTRTQMESVFEGLIRSKGSRKRNRLLVYVASHGFSVEQDWGGFNGYLVGIDAPLYGLNPEGFEEKSMSLLRIGEYARRLKSNHVLFVFDSCFAGTVFTQAKGGKTYIEEKTGKAVRQFITSGSQDEEVPDNSQFRRQFLEGLRGAADLFKDGYVTGTELGIYLRNKLITYSNGTQHPQYGKLSVEGLDKGDFVFQLPQEGGADEEIVVPPEVSLDRFYSRLLKLEKHIQQGKRQYNRKRLQLAEDAYNSLRGLAGADPIELARVGKNLKTAFRELYRHEREEREKVFEDENRREKQARIEALSKKVRKLPSSKYKENLEGYEELLRLDPGNQRFKNKVAHYQKKLDQSKQPPSSPSPSHSSSSGHPSPPFPSPSDSSSSPKNPRHPLA